MSGEKISKKAKVLGAVGGMGLAVVTATVSGFFETVGSRFGEAYVAPATGEPGLPGGSPADAANPSLPIVNGNSGAEQASAGPTAQAAMPIVIDTIPLDFGATGTGSSRDLACRTALDQIERNASYQCEQISKESKAASFRIEGADSGCRSCAELSSGWSCVAQAKPKCILLD